MAGPGVNGPASARLGVSRLATLRIVVVYGAILAAASLGLAWLQYRYLVRTYSFEVYVALVALAFLGLGVWAGARLFRRATPAAPFEPNTRVQQTLGISERELEVLELLVHGHTYADVASALGIAEGTVQTYVKRIYEKLDVSTKAEAALLAVARGLVRP